jgi:tetratricopeptide (TPR) repeat protein
MLLVKKYPIYLLTVFFILSTNILIAQERDSLIGLLQHAKSDTNKVNLLNKIASTFVYSNPIEGKPYSETAFLLARELNFKSGQAKSCYYLGVIYALSGNAIEAEKSYQVALSIYRNINNFEGEANVLGQLGSLYLAEDKFDEALEYRLESLRLYEQIGNKACIAIALTNIGIIYARTAQLSDAEKYFKKAIVVKKEIGDERGESIIYTNLGALYYDQQDFELSLQYFKIALEIQERLGDVRIIVTCKTNIGNIYTSQKKFAEARALHEECFEIYESMGDTSGLARTYLSFGEIDFRSKKFQEAIVNYDKAVALLENLGGRDVLRAAYTGLCESYIALNETEKATEYVDKILEIAHTTFSEELSTNMAQLREEYNAEKREQNILLLKEKNSATQALSEKRKLLIVTISAFAAIVLLGLFLVIAVNRNRKKQKEIEFIKMKTALEQTALRAQMNPHFIFNALNSIQHYILNKETEYAYDYLAKFGKLIRQILINSEENSIALNKEIETLKLYIELEQRRFKNKFDFEITIPDDFPADEISIPTMLIQPFVENAIWHGIMNLDKSIDGKLKLGFHYTNNTLHIIVEDNGIGRKDAALRKINNEYKSVGVLFSKKRLELLEAITNQKAQINIEDLEDENGKSSGTKVEITIAMKA